MKHIIGIRAIISLILVIILLSIVPASIAESAFKSYEIFSLQIHLPEGAKIEYLRLYFYDSTYDNGIAWLTTYNGSGDLTDLVNVSTSGSSGYGQSLSDLFEHIVDNHLYTYVLNWRPCVFDSSMRLMGMRIAFRMPEGGGWSASYSYLKVAGCTFTPRNSTVEWRYPGAGGIYAASWSEYMPFINK